MLVGLATIVFLYRREVLTGAAAEWWAVGFLLSLAVASSSYALIGLRRYMAARTAAISRGEADSTR